MFPSSSLLLAVSCMFCMSCEPPFVATENCCLPSWGFGGVTNRWLDFKLSGIEDIFQIELVQLVVLIKIESSLRCFRQGITIVVHIEIAIKWASYLSSMVFRLLPFPSMSIILREHALSKNDYIFSVWNLQPVSNVI